MTKHTIYLLAFLNIIVSSCSKDWLDEKPDIATVIPSTLADVQSLMDNSDVMNTYSPGFGEIASDGHYMTDASFSTRQEIERNAYSWSNDFSYRDVSEWFERFNRWGGYARVFYCNLVLESLNKYKPANSADQLEWNNIKGQALFQRSRTLYELAQVFAPSYQSSTAGSDMGIPLRLETDINVPSARASLQQTYDQIVNDLQKAKELLPTSPLYKTRASKVAVFALLSRIYLSMEKYESAFLNADSSLRLYNKLLNYNDLITSDPFPIQVMNTEVIFHSTIASYTTIGSQMLIDPNLIALYESSDLRIKAFFGSNANGRTFKGGYNGNRVNFNGLATDEQYLIRAECYARSGKVTEAIADLNHLLRNRWDSNVAYIDLTAVDAEDALRQVLLERRKELLLRGLRWSDLRRLNRDPRFAITLTRTIAGQAYTLEPDSYKYTFPIPDDIIEMTGMPQNPGWEK